MTYTRILALLLTTSLVAARAAIDRRAVVARHALQTAVSDATLLSPLDVYTIGNGDFAINVDATGLQTLNATFATAAISTALALRHCMLRCGSCSGCATPDAEEGAVPTPA